MKKEVTAVFRLTEKEIKEALYDFYVRKLKSNNVNAYFCQEDIEIQADYVEVVLTIKEQKDLD